MTVEQAYETLFKNGHFLLLVLSIEDVKEHLIGQDGPEPSEEDILKAIQKVAKHWDNYEDFTAAMTMVEEKLNGAP
jgi:hypothetical protein